jgi:hypothetical protein
VLFSFNLLSEFQRALDLAIKSCKQPATLRFTVFTCGAVLGRSGHYLVFHMSKKWGGSSQRKPLFNSLLHLASNRASAAAWSLQAVYDLAAKRRVVYNLPAIDSCCGG